jgi:hypothetical protein
MQINDVYLLVGIVGGVLGAIQTIVVVQKHLSKSKNDKLQSLRKYASNLTNRVKIENPEENQEFVNTKILKVTGTFKGEIKDEFKFLLIAELNHPGNHNFFIMKPRICLNLIRKKDEYNWEHNNVVLSSDHNSVEWKLHFCVTNAEGYAWYNERVNNDNWKGFSDLPDEVLSITNVKIKQTK